MIITKNDFINTLTTILFVPTNILSVVLVLYFNDRSIEAAVVLTDSELLISSIIVSILALLSLLLSRALASFAYTIFIDSI
jgi:hypothetical protein